MKKRSFFLGTLLLLLLLVPVTVLAAQGYALDWWTINSGGGLSQGSDYSLQGSIGQPDAAQSQGGQFTLAGGFWTGGPRQPEPLRIYLPMTVKR